MTVQLVLTATSAYSFTLRMNTFVTSKKPRVDERHIYSLSVLQESKNDAVTTPVNNDAQGPGRVAQSVKHHPDTPRLWSSLQSGHIQ